MADHPAPLEVLARLEARGVDEGDQRDVEAVAPLHEPRVVIVGRRIEDGAFRPVDPRLAARAFFGIIVHHRLLHDILGLPMHRTHEETVHEYVSVFLSGLAQPTTRTEQAHS